jgi:molybdopterin-guanine dinucleotide biosynthesis adapter protein
MKVLVFVGYSESGKTFTIVNVVRQLVKAGKKVGTLKHIHDEGFTMDTVGKDTWRHGEAGASTVIALAPNELAIIEKGDTRKLTLDELVRLFRSRGVDYLLVEGLYRRFSRRRGVLRILCVKNLEEAEELLKEHERPLCILNRKKSGGTTFHGIPMLKLPRDMERLMAMIYGKGN